MLLILTLFACPSEAPEDDTAGADAADTSGDALPGPSGAGRQTRACASDDGAAVELVVGLDGEGCEVPYAGVPHLRVTLWTPWPLPAGTHVFDATNASAWMSTDGVMESAVKGGELVLDADGTGSYRVDVQGGDSYEGTFTLDSCDSDILCG